jgi:hypothetical protein
MKLDIYGSRRKILFVEGTEESLDKPLYGILFPEVTVVPKGNCRDVERSTIGVKSSANLHWACAYGLIDADGRENELKELIAEGICAIECYSVESLYYHPEMIKIISQRVSVLDGSDPDARTNNAITAALKAIHRHRDRLCARVATRKLHELVLSSTPGPNEVVSGNDVSIVLPVSNFISREFLLFDTAIANSDYQKLVQRYPLRETPALSEVASQMGFRTRKEYEAAVLKACGDEEGIRSLVIGWLGPLSKMLGENQASNAEQDNVLDALKSTGDR